MSTAPASAARPSAARKPCVNEDILNSPQGAPWRQAGRETGVVACVALPLIKAGRSIGVLMFFVSQSWARRRRGHRPVDADGRERLVRAGQFRPRRQKAKAEKQKDRLTRMFEALERHQRSDHAGQIRAELFELVCEAAVLGGNFTSTVDRPAEPGRALSRDGRRRRTGPGAGRSNVRLSIDAARPEGRGMTGTAFRTGSPASATITWPTSAQRHFIKAAERRRHALRRRLAAAQGRRRRSACCCFCPANSARSAPN